MKFNKFGSYTKDGEIQKASSGRIPRHSKGARLMHLSKDKQVRHKHKIN